MSMMFSGDRDYIGDVNGVKYYRDSNGNLLSDDGFSMDVVDEYELSKDIAERLSRGVYSDNYKLFAATLKYSKATHWSKPFVPQPPKEQRE